MPRTIEVYGAADAGASGSRSLSAPIESTVVAIDAPAGTRVAAGQVIARLRPSPSAQLDYSKALAEVRQTSDAYARAQRLRADGLSSNADVETARAAAASAAATLSSMQRRSQSTSLVAPTSGTVTSVESSPGALVAAGTTIATVTATQGIRGRFGVDPATARSITPGSVVRVAPASGGAAFSLPVSSVDPVVDPQTRLASIYVSLPPQALIGSGEPLHGQIVLKDGGGALVVPYSALLDDGGQPFVFVVVKNIAHRRNVTVGSTDSNWATITRGVSAGEVVITQGGTALEDGMKVRIR
ncbi:efflux RND transporter periplasmic adaptor subunit [Sphingomonas flavescens]|uniref:efflux RND transporter periplasmic adaptor subunit n=1 Tax=Sphingomonas flavescens TaxID=3132797 RepID=UPI003B21996D